ncbi:hypothetical protein D3C74_470050 [compost metagenome]
MKSVRERSRRTGIDPLARLKASWKSGLASALAIPRWSLGRLALNITKLSML